jgi:PD-(D/E)XK endonuclease
VQVGCARRGCHQCPHKQVADDSARGIRVTYQLDEIDALAAYCEALDRSYLLPVSMVAGRHSVHLRTTEPRNNQRAAINFASEFELGAVAQLEERSDGIRKAEGSSPSSSTDEGAAGSPREEVGAHIFRNHFGYYLERAAAGHTILVPASRTHALVRHSRRR